MNKVKSEWVGFSNSIKNIDFENFLRNDVVKCTMFFNNMETNLKEYSFIKEIFDIKLIENVSKISEIGNPDTIKVDNFILNGNIIHHLYHLARYKKTTEKMVGKNILEWGGGYGNMSAIINIIKDVENYTIIDLPELISLQCYFLTKIFGEENVGIMENKKINLVPLSNIEDIDYTIFDSFISNWALSESDIFYHDFCEKNNLFDVENILISYHLCGYHIPFMEESLNIDNICKRKKLKIEELKIDAGINYYAVK